MGERVVLVSCGWRHTAALTHNKSLYTWGHGGFGQLGHGGTVDFFLPLRLDSHEHWENVKCGWRHTAALAAGGAAFTWGDGEHMQLGHGDRLMTPRPKAISSLRETRVMQLECGSHHCIALSEAGKVRTIFPSLIKLKHEILGVESEPPKISNVSGEVTPPRIYTSS